MVAEEFTAVINRPVLVAVQHEQPIVAVDPARPLRESVVVKIKVHVLGTDMRGFDTVAVQIQNDGRGFAF